MFTPWDFYCIVPRIESASFRWQFQGPAFPGRPKIQATEVVCPACRSSRIRRSRRRTLVEYLLGIAGILPWRCELCETRFRARRAPFRHLIFAHCRICGYLELQRISEVYVPGRASIFGSILGVPAFRCVPRSEERRVGKEWSSGCRSV